MSNDISKTMDFEVASDFDVNKAKVYNIKIDLEEEVSAQIRDAAINFAGIIVRNAKYEIYGNVNDEKLAEIMREKLNSWLGKYNFKANKIALTLKQTRNK